MFHNRGFYQPLLALLMISMMLIVFGNLYQYSLSVQKTIGPKMQIYERHMLISSATCPGDYYLAGKDLATDGIKITNAASGNLHEIHVYYMDTTGVTEKLYWNDGGPNYEEFPELIAGDSECFFGTQVVTAHSTFYVQASEGASKIDVSD